MSPNVEVGEYYLDVQQAARRYSVSEWFFRNRMRSESVPFHRVGKYVRFKPAELDAWFDSLGAAGRLPEPRSSREASL